MLPAATATSETETAANQATINELLGQEAEVEEAPAKEVETEEPAEATETTEAEESSEAAEETAEEATEEAAEAEEEAEEAEEESELSLDENDRDYSQAAYVKAAKHYSRTHGVQLNPDDPAHRVLLKEVMDRGRALAAQKDAEADKAKTDEDKPAEEAKTATVRPTPEQIRESIGRIQEVAKQRVVPEVAMHVFSRFVKALWPQEKVTITQEQANDFTSALHEFFLMAMDDAAPAINGMVSANFSNDPVWGTVQRQAIDASAFEHLDKSLGSERFADMEKLVEDGTLKGIIAKNPNVFSGIKAGDGKNPILNRAAQLEAAYKFARGEKTLDQVTQAVKTGKKQATDNAKKIAASRTAPGTPKGGFNQPATSGEQLVRDITGGEGSTSKFASATKKFLQPAGSFNK